MAQFITGGADTFDALTYGQPHPGTLQFLENQFYGNTAQLTEASQRFMDSARGAFERFSSSSAIRMAKAARRAVGSLWENDDIRALTTIEELQWAKLPMQRWIMANPYVRKRFHQQTIEGYEGSFVDSYPDEIGEGHYDYHRVMDGVLVEEEDGWSATTYFDELLPDDVDLTIEEQEDILTTWQAVTAHIRAGGEDPTSRWNASL